MSVYKDNATGKWRVIYRYTDITGKRKQTQKRGFETKREAVAWEHEMMLKSQAKLDMTFGSFYEIYEADAKWYFDMSQVLREAYQLRLGFFVV